MGLVENLVMLFSGYNEISWELRNVLDTCDSWECANKRLSSDNINALGYIILAGTKENEGVVISRNRFGPAHQDNLNDTNWYLVQTNSDHWKLGHPCNTSRCGAARKHIDEIGQHDIDIYQLRDKVLLRYPNLNDLTIYNSIMIPATG
jgi:N-acylethanolamine-hydrolysing acid amidase